MRTRPFGPKLHNYYPNVANSKPAKFQFTVDHYNRSNTRMIRVKFDPVWLIFPALLTLWYSWTSTQYAVDFWHCLISGRAIWLNSSTLVSDTTTFTIGGTPLLEQSWLGRLSLYALFNLGGFNLTQFVTGLLYATAVLLVTLLAWRRSGNVHIAAGLGVVVLALAMSNLTVRTQAIAMPLFAAELCVLWLWPNHKRTIVVVGLIEIVWANTHGSFPLGVVLPGLFLLAMAWKQRWMMKPTENCYLACLLASFLAVFCNPHPASTLNYVVGVVSKSSQHGIEEWATATSGSHTSIAFLVSAIVAVIVAAILVLRGRHLQPIELLLLVVFAVLGYQAERMVIWWALAAAPVLAGIIGHHKKAGDRSIATVFIILALAGITAVSTPWTKQFNPMLSAGKRQALPDDEPHQTVRFLRQEGVRGRVFCPMEWGAYLSWHLDAKVFIDSRIDYFPDDVWDTYVDVGRVQGDWQGVLDKYQVDTIVWNHQMSNALPLALQRSTKWDNVYQDELGVVFLRRRNNGT